MVLAAVGKNGTGKDFFLEYVAKTYGFPMISIGDVVRELAASEGLPLEEAWRAITINPARATGIADRVGSLEEGKDADVVIWNSNPLTTIGAHAYMTIIDGNIVYKEN